MKRKFILNQPSETKALAAQVASRLKIGDVLCLNGDLGTGKTTFTKGLANGLGIRSVIKSPTFTIVREYMEGRLPLYHMDAYRLEGCAFDELGLDEYFNGDGVSVIEWAQFIVNELPNDYLRIDFEKTNVEDQRVLFLDPQGRHFNQLVAGIAYEW